MSTIYGNGVSAVGGSSDNYDKRSVVTVGIFKSSDETKREEWHTEKSCDFYVAGNRSNSSKVINEAIASLPKYGGTVVLKPGNYWIDLSDPILIDRQNVCIDGVSGAALVSYVPDGSTIDELSPMIKIVTPNAAITHITSVANVRLKNLCLRLLRDHNVIGISIPDGNECRNVCIENVSFDIQTGTGAKKAIYLGADSGNSVVKDNYFWLTAGNDALNTTVIHCSGRYTKIVDNLIHTGNSVLYYMGIDEDGSRNSIVGNDIYHTCVGIRVGNNVLNSNSIIVNNAISGIGTVAGDYDGSDIEILSRNNIVGANRCKDISVLSNYIEDNVYYGHNIEPTAK